MPLNEFVQDTLIDTIRRIGASASTLPKLIFLNPITDIVAPTYSSVVFRLT